MMETDIGQARTRAIVRKEEALCPNCLKMLCKLRRGGKATGVELWCKYCRATVMLEIK